VAIQKFLLNQCTGLPRCARNDGHIELISGSLTKSNVFVVVSSVSPIAIQTDFIRRIGPNNCSVWACHFVPFALSLSKGSPSTSSGRTAQGLSEQHWDRAMKIMSARDAKNPFGKFLDSARREPVVVTRNDRPVGIMISSRTQPIR